MAENSSYKAMEELVKQAGHGAILFSSVFKKAIVYNINKHNGKTL